jgi:hypothetical protein
MATAKGCPNKPLDVTARLANSYSIWFKLIANEKYLRLALIANKPKLIANENHKENGRFFVFDLTKVILY